MNSSSDFQTRYTGLLTRYNDLLSKYTDIHTIDESSLVMVRDEQELIIRALIQLKIEQDIALKQNIEQEIALEQEIARKQEMKNVRALVNDLYFEKYV